MNIPTCIDIWDEDSCESHEDYDLVSQHHDNSWRHGTRETDVYMRKSDGTFWEVKYRLSTDGETNELREGLATIKRVFPHSVMVTQYKDAPQ